MLRGKVSYARPFAKARLIEQEPHILAQQVSSGSCSLHERTTLAGVHDYVGWALPVVLNGM